MRENGHLGALSLLRVYATLSPFAPLHVSVQRAHAIRRRWRSVWRDAGYTCPHFRFPDMRRLATWRFVHPSRLSYYRASALPRAPRGPRAPRFHGFVVCGPRASARANHTSACAATRLLYLRWGEFPVRTWLTSAPPSANRRFGAMGHVVKPRYLGPRCTRIATPARRGQRPSAYVFISRVSPKAVAFLPFRLDRWWAPR